MTREEEARYLADIRRMAAAASTDWQRGMTPSGEGILGRLVPGHAPTPIFIFDPWTDKADIAFALEAPRAIAFLLGLVDRAIAAHKRASPPAPKPKQKDFAAECAMKCAERGFQKWLHEVHGLDHPTDANRVATKVRLMLAIISRADLNTDPEAAARWRAMAAAYEAWRKMR